MIIRDDEIMEGIHERKKIACLKIKTNIGILIVLGSISDVLGV